MEKIEWRLGEAFTDGEVVRFKLGTRKFGDKWAVVDASDWDAIRDRRWTVKSVATLFYATNTQHGAFTYLHRAIMAPPADLVVDHIDGDGLNNRRENLRICTLGENFSHAMDRKRGHSYPDELLERWLKKRGWPSALQE